MIRRHTNILSYALKVRMHAPASDTSLLLPSHLPPPQTQMNPQPELLSSGANLTGKVSAVASLLYRSGLSGKRRRTVREVFLLLLPLLLFLPKKRHCCRCWIVKDLSACQPSYKSMTVSGCATVVCVSSLIHNSL